LLCSATDPENFPDVFLERPNPEYAKWILEPKTWGGAIELAILSDHYQTEIGAIDVATSHMYCYGEGKSYRQRVYLVYDGLHYDALGLNFSPDGPEEFDMTVFSPQDSYVFNNALAIVRSLKQKHLYTDTAAFLLSCSDCQAGAPSSFTIKRRATHDQQRVQCWWARRELRSTPRQQDTPTSPRKDEEARRPQHHLPRGGERRPLQRNVG